MTGWSETINGAVRPVLAVVFGLSFCVAFLVQVFGGTGVEIKDAFIGMAGLILGWYFGKREADKDTAAVATQAAERAVVLTEGAKKQNGGGG